MYTNSKKRWALFPLAIVAGATFFGFLVMLLWNYLMPEIFHLPEISFWQALLLLLLCRILFGGHFKHGNDRHFRLHQRMETMSPEEREAFREKWNSAYRFRNPVCRTQTKSENSKADESADESVPQ